MLLKSVRNKATVDVERLPGNVTGSLRGQEYRHGGNVFRLVGTSHRNGLGAAACHFFQRDVFLLRPYTQVGFRERGACEKGGLKAIYSIFVPQFVMCSRNILKNLLT